MPAEGLFAIRATELLFAALWVLGIALVYRYTQECFAERCLILGIYFGATFSWHFDWVMGGPEVWNLEFHPDTIWLASWGSRNEALWAPLSYGVFFGLIVLGWRKLLDPPLEKYLGIYRYLAIFPISFIANIVIEGSMIEFAQTNIYHQPPNQLVANIPWLHLITTGSMATMAIFLTNEALHILKQSNPGESYSTHIQKTKPPSLRRKKAGIFILGFCLPQTAFSLTTLAGLYMYGMIR